MAEHRVRRVAIVVLGEIGQSPRMQLHARALTEHNVTVDIIAYTGDVTPDWLRTHPLVSLWSLPAGWPGRHRLPHVMFSLYALCRVIRITCSLTWTLMVRTSKPDVILLQTPPPVPTLPACLLAAWLRGTETVIDWHNYGYTILALRLGERHWIVRLTFWAERVFGRRATHHLCVSQAMRRDLAARWSIADALVLYDRPPEQFGEASGADRRRLFEGLAGTLIPEDMARACAAGSEERPAILVSPTSWTMDEDFTLLLDALEQCDAAITREEPNKASAEKFPHLIVFLTGNGPMRQHYEERIAALDLQRILIRTGWLSHENFAILLGAADLGLCLHTSSSGVDLPMKIAEMQGARLPVCAFDYGPCLAEMIEPGKTGLLFRDSEMLAQQIGDLFRDFPRNADRLNALRDALRDRPLRRWHEEWDEVAAELLGLES